MVPLVNAKYCLGSAVLVHMLQYPAVPLPQVLYKPGKKHVPHSKQSDGEVAPLDVVYFPVPHCKQEDAPLNVEYFPGEQARHVDKLVGPDSVEYVPGAHPPTIWLDTRGTAHIAITATFINRAHVIFKRINQHTYIQVI
jgi:hypothetical protein